MIAATMVLCAWLLFGATHLILGMPPLRNRLVQKLGEPYFVALFSAIAAFGLGVLALSVAMFGGEGATGPALATMPLARLLLLTLSFVGLMLAVAGLLNYMRSPMALFRTALHPPVGIERITRHAFFVGLALFTCAHALLAATLAISIYFAGFAVLAIVGAVLQDRKLLVKYGDAYAHYLAATSLVPFAAVLQKRQRLTMDDRLPQRFALSAAIALLVFAMHPLWTTLHGAPFAGLMAIGGIMASARRWWYSRTSARAAYLR
jgi:uncharacterized membrane protein